MVTKHFDMESFEHYICHNHREYVKPFSYSTKNKIVEKDVLLGKGSVICILYKISLQNSATSEKQDIGYRYHITIPFTYVCVVIFMLSNSQEVQC